MTYEDFINEIVAVTGVNRSQIKFKMNTKDNISGEPAYKIMLGVKDKIDDRSSLWYQMNAHYEKGNASQTLDNAKVLVACAKYDAGNSNYVLGMIYKVQPRKGFLDSIKKNLFYVRDENGDMLPIDRGEGYYLDRVVDFDKYFDRLVFNLEKPIQQTVTRFEEKIANYNPKIIQKNSKRSDN